MKRSEPWLRLAALCATASLVLTLGLAIIAASAALAFSATQPANQAAKQVHSGRAPRPQSVVGMVTDSHCGARHAADSGKTAAGCARACRKQGAKYALVAVDRVYLLEGDDTAIDPLAGQRAKITGAVAGDSIKVSSVSPAR